MTREEMKSYIRKSELGLIADFLNPAFIFSDTEMGLLSMIAKGEINAVELAKRTLEQRGLDINGRWVGFNNTIE